MLIYLASPYSHHDPEVKLERFIEACKAAAYLMDSGYQVFCPIAHSHPIEVHGMDYVHNGDFWLKQDYAILKHCDELCVLMLEGWKNSNGIAHEIDFAIKNNIRVSYMEAGTHAIADTVPTVYPSQSLCAA